MLPEGHVLHVHYRSWREAELVPLNRPMPAEEWLGIVAAHPDIALQVPEPVAEIRGGPYDGCISVWADAEVGEREVFLVHPCLLPRLAPYRWDVPGATRRRPELTPDGNLPG